MGKFKLWDGMSIPMFTREEWGAAKPELFKEFECLELPLSFVRYCYEDMLGKHNTTETIQALKECQKDHMQVQGYEDIKYNFAINAEGILFECRGWFTEPAHHIKYRPLRYKIIDICFIGDFSEKDPPWPMMRTAHYFVMKGLRKLYINSNFRLIGLRDPPDGELGYI